MNPLMILSILIILTQSSFSTVDGSPRRRDGGQSSTVRQVTMLQQEPLQDARTKWKNLFHELCTQQLITTDVVKKLNEMSMLEEINGFLEETNGFSDDSDRYLYHYNSMINVAHSKELMLDTERILTDVLLRAFHQGDTDCSVESFTFNLNMSNLYNFSESIGLGLKIISDRRMLVCWGAWMKLLAARARRFEGEGLQRLDSIVEEFEFRPEDQPFSLAASVNPGLVEAESKNYVEKLVNYFMAFKRDRDPEYTDFDNVFKSIISTQCEQIVQSHEADKEQLDDFLMMFTSKMPFMDKEHLEMIDRLRMCRVINSTHDDLKDNVMGHLAAIVHSEYLN